METHAGTMRLPASHRPGSKSTVDSAQYRPGSMVAAWQIHAHSSAVSGRDLIESTSDRQHPEEA